MLGTRQAQMVAAPVPPKGSGRPAGWPRRRASLAPPPAQPRLHERVQVAVEDRFDVARLVTRTLVFDLLVWSQHIGADELSGPADLMLRTADGGEFGPAFFPLAIGQLGRQDLHG